MKEQKNNPIPTPECLEIFKGHMEAINQEIQKLKCELIDLNKRLEETASYAVDDYEFNEFKELIEENIKTLDSKIDMEIKEAKQELSLELSNQCCGLCFEGGR